MMAKLGVRTRPAAKARRTETLELFNAWADPLTPREATVWGSHLRGERGPMVVH